MPLGKEITSQNYTEEVNKKNAIVNDTAKIENKPQTEIIFVPEEPKYSLDDIILPNNVKEQILDIADYAKNTKFVYKK